MNATLLLLARTARFLLLWMVIWAPCLLLAKPLLDTVAMEAFSDISGAVAVLIASYLSVRIAKRGGLDKVGFSTSGLAVRIAQGVTLGLAMSGAVLAILLLTRSAHSGGGVVISAPSPAALTVVSLVFNSFLQEGLVRGVILTEANELFGPAVAIAWSSILFMAIHVGIYRGSGESVLMALNLLLAGCALGLSVLWSRSIWLAVAAHFAWNMSESLIYGRSTGAALFAGFDGAWVKLSTPSLETGPFGLLGPAVGVAIMAACYALGRRRA